MSEQPPGPAAGRSTVAHGSASPDGLVSEEGVDEGSADVTDEGPRPPAGDGVLGPGTQGSPDRGQDPTGPVDLGSATSQAARERIGTGQQVAQGEG